MKRLILAIALTLIAGSAAAQHLYSAKFVCGKTNNDHTVTFTAAPGQYFTAINVHNPSTTATANIRKRFSVGRLGERPGPLSGFFSMTLPPGTTGIIECRSIHAETNIPIGTWIDGFAEIRSNVELDVVGVYTVAGTQGVSSILMERVPRRAF